jgi:hypothetical protein
MDWIWNWFEFGIITILNLSELQYILFLVGLNLIKSKYSIKNHFTLKHVILNEYNILEL